MFGFYSSFSFISLVALIFAVVKAFKHTSKIKELEHRINSLEKQPTSSEKKSETIIVPEYKPTEISEPKISGIKYSPPFPQPTSTKPVDHTSYSAPKTSTPREPNAIEKFFSGENILIKVGALAILIGTAIGFKMAIDSNLIGEIGRVAIGIISGLALIAAGEFHQNKKLTNAASGFIGAGEGIIYISIYFAQHSYHLIPPGMAFFLDALLTAVVFVQAIRYNSQNIAFMGLVGGFITPILASSGSGNYFGLSIYLLILNSAVLAISFKYNWALLKNISYVFTVGYLLKWSSEIPAEGNRYFNTAYYHNRHFSHSLTYFVPMTLIFFFYYTAITCYRNLKLKIRFEQEDIALSLINAVFTFAILYLKLNDAQRPYLGLLAILLSAVFLGLVTVIYKQKDIDHKASNTFLGIGAWFLFSAIPIICSGHYITIAWSLVAVAAAIISKQKRFSGLHIHIGVIFGIVILRLLVWDEIFVMPRYVAGESYSFLGNLTTVTAVIVAVCFGAVAKITKGLEHWGKAANALQFSIVVLTSVILFRESLSISYPMLAGKTSLVFAKNFALILWLSLTSLITIFFAGNSKDEKTISFLSVITIGLSAFACFSFWWITPFYRMGNHSFLSFFWHFGSGLLLILLWLCVLSFRRVDRLEIRSEYNFNPLNIIMVCTLALIVVILRREIYSIIYLPPFGDMFSTTMKTSLFNMGTSVAYSILAFVLYVFGTKKGRVNFIWAGNVIFGLTGLKVCILDLASAHNFYRMLTFIAFGLILILSAKITEKQRRDEKTK